jgi:hypothetical protein
MRTVHRSITRSVPDPLARCECWVEGGADVGISDTAWNATPLGWAEHYVENSKPERRARYAEVAEYLRTV